MQIQSITIGHGDTSSHSRDFRDQQMYLCKRELPVVLAEKNSFFAGKG